MFDINSDLIEFRFDDYLFTFSNKTHFEIYNDPKNYYGIIFYVDKTKYDVIHSLVGNRLIMNTEDYEKLIFLSKDIPFNDSTTCYLPDCVKVKKI